MNIEVKIWGETCAYLDWDDQRSIARLQLDAKNWRKLSPIVLTPNADNIYEFTEHSRSGTFKGLPGLVYESLPDKYGSAILEVYKKRTGRSVANPIVDLTYIGTRGMGALEYHPSTTPAGLQTSYSIDINEIRELAVEVLSEREELSGSLSDKQALEELIAISASPGGMRAKGIIAVDKDRKTFKSGQVEAPEGFEYYLLKFDSEDNTLGDPKGYGLIEMAYSEMVKECKIDMMPCEIYREGGRNHFMTKRFDRLGKDKLHVQSLASLCHYDYEQIGAYGYEQCFGAMRKLELPHSDREQMFRRMSFNIMARNQDDHVKNISFGLEKNGEWKLNPAYDMVYSYNPAKLHTKTHNMSLGGKRDRFTKEDLLLIARAEGINRPEVILKEMSDVIKTFPDYAREQGVSDRHIERISNNLRVRVAGIKKSNGPKL